MALFYNSISLLVFMAAALLSLLLYMGDIRSRLVAVAGMCQLQVFLFSMAYIIEP